MQNRGRRIGAPSSLVLAHGNRNTPNQGGAPASLHHTLQRTEAHMRTSVGQPRRARQQGGSTQPAAGAHRPVAASSSRQHPSSPTRVHCDSGPAGSPTTNPGVHRIQPARMTRSTPKPISSSSCPHQREGVHTRVVLRGQLLARAQAAGAHDLRIRCRGGKRGCEACDASS